MPFPTISFKHINVTFSFCRQYDSMCGRKTFTKKASPLQFTENTELAAIFQVVSTVSGNICNTRNTVGIIGKVDLVI